MLLQVVATAAILLSSGEGAAPVESSDPQLMQVAFDRAFESSREFWSGEHLLVECSTQTIAPTGGVPIEHSPALSAHLFRNEVSGDVALSMPKVAEIADLASYRQVGGYDWTRLAQRVPTPGAVIHVSRPGYSASGTEAVVQVAVFIPTGYRGWYLFTFERKDQAWEVVDRQSSWAPIGYTFNREVDLDYTREPRAN